MRAGVFVADDKSFEIPLLAVVGTTLPNAEAANGWGGDSIMTVDGPEAEWVVV